MTSQEDPRMPLEDWEVRHILKSSDYPSDPRQALHMFSMAFWGLVATLTLALILVLGIYGIVAVLCRLTGSC